jgi:hypothetical protein
MAKRNYYQGKRSEYRNNYLPFDYYDFWMTAKENENLRFRNKIRDYIHTPFDWNEDEDVYLETVDKFDQFNQATQTTQRPIMIENHKTSQRHHSGKGQQQQNTFSNVSDDITINQNQNKVKNNSQFLKNKPRKNKRNRSKSAKASTGYNSNNNKNRTVQNFIEPKFDEKRKHEQNYNSSMVNKNKLENVAMAKNSCTIEKNQNKSNSRANNTLNRSMTNIAVQTPFGWCLRDFNQNKMPKRSLSRSASVTNLQEKKPPFAHYGWATRNKDLAFKPTQNALANKVNEIIYTITLLNLTTTTTTTTKLIRYMKSNLNIFRNLLIIMETKVPSLN